MAISKVAALPYYDNEHAEAVRVLNVFGNKVEVDVDLAAMLRWGSGDYSDLAAYLPKAFATAQSHADLPRTPAWDVRFGAAKDHSMLWALADETMAPWVNAAHQAGVEAAVSYLSTHGVVGRKRTGHGARVVVPLDPLVLAVDHNTNRWEQPHIHTHALFFHDGFDQDSNTMRALHTPWLYRQFAASRAIQRAVSRHSVASVFPGIEYQSTVVGQQVAHRVTIFTDTQREAFSQRRNLLTYIQKHLGINIRTPSTSVEADEFYAAMQQAVYSTRPLKSDQKLSPAAYRDLWRRLAADVGIDAQDIARLVDSPSRSIQHDHKSLFTSARDLLSKQYSTWTRENLIISLCDSSPYGFASVDEIEALADEFLSLDSLSVSVVPTFADGTPITSEDHSVVPQKLTPTSEIADSSLSRLRNRFTTPDLLEKEQQFAAWMNTADGSTTVVSPSVFQTVLAKYPTLSDEQRLAVEVLTTSPKAGILVRGGPGSGKTFMLRTAAEAWASMGIKVIGVAKTGQAATELESAVAETYTIDSFLLKYGSQETSEPFVILCDEASMASTPELHEVGRLAQRVGGRLCLVGDHRQLASIDAGGVFTHLWLRSSIDADPVASGRAEMRGNQRQVSIDLRDVVAAVERNDPRSAIKILTKTDKWHMSRDADSLMLDLVTQWYNSRSKGPTEILAAKRDDVVRLNYFLRQFILDHPEQHYLGEVVADMAPSLESPEAGEREYRMGERIMCLKNQRFNYPQQYSKHGKLETHAFVRNSWAGEIIDATLADITVRFDNGRVVTLPRSYVRDSTTYAWARTVYRAQGITIGSRSHHGTALIYRPEILDSASSWVAMTRATHDVHLYQLLPATASVRLLDDTNPVIDTSEVISAIADDPFIPVDEARVRPDEDSSKFDKVIKYVLDETDGLEMDMEVKEDPLLTEMRNALEAVVGKWRLRYRPDTSLDVAHVLTRARAYALSSGQARLRMWNSNLRTISAILDTPVQGVDTVSDDILVLPLGDMSTRIVSCIYKMLESPKPDHDAIRYIGDWLLASGEDRKDTHLAFANFQQAVLNFGDADLTKQFREVIDACSSTVHGDLSIDRSLAVLRSILHQQIKDVVIENPSVPARLDEIKYLSQLAVDFSAEMERAYYLSPTTFAQLYHVSPDQVEQIVDLFEQSRIDTTEMQQRRITNEIAIQDSYDPDIDAWYDEYDDVPEMDVYDDPSLTPIPNEPMDYYDVPMDVPPDDFTEYVSESVETPAEVEIQEPSPDEYPAPDAVYNDDVIPDDDQTPDVGGMTL